MNKTLQSSNTPRQKLLNRLEQNEARTKETQAKKFNVPPAGVRKSPISGIPPGQTPKPSNRPGSLAARANKVMERNPTWNKANVEKRVAKRYGPESLTTRVSSKAEKPKAKQFKALKLRPSAGTGSKPPTIKTKARVKKPKK